MAEKYACQINFMVNVEADDEVEAASLILEQAKATVNASESGFTFKRESDGQIFLTVGGKAMRVPKTTIGASPRL
jgi:hypothetical protein